MEIVFTVVAIIAMIMLGMLLIHSLNAKHDERIAVFRYSDALPGTGRRSRRPRPSAGPAESPGSPGATAHRESDDGDENRDGGGDGR
ncbi:hypothetical protein [Streptomyces sp. DSM 40750]|uniref:hypothetical protein n=1 Tax=Streptomyces sp. DSM 40750 TaxID=2801030 RepID=UPI00214ADDA1|nr:hypothetical protein [Streptomyces sp. DSM 40750]UUU26866.1 hypothetical protein JIX55_45295 [Streptomyces sp. DSM 40750]